MLIEHPHIFTMLTLTVHIISMELLALSRENSALSHFLVLVSGKIAILKKFKKISSKNCGECG